MLAVSLFWIQFHPSFIPQQLLLAAAQMDQYQHLVKQALDYAKEKRSTVDEQIKLAMDKYTRASFPRTIHDRYQ